MEIAASTAQAQERPLVILLGSEPATLDPLRATDANGVRISHQLIFETFVTLGDDLSVQPGLAQWERVSPTHYRFRLPKGRRFHNGAPLTAEDAVHTLERFMAPEVGSPYGGVLREEIASVTRTGDLTFEIRLNAPYAAFLSHLILPVISRAPDGVPTPWGDLNGSGPFRYEDRRVGELQLGRFVGYPESPGVPRVLFKFVKDDSTRLAKFRKGDIDLGINVLPLDKLKQFTRAPLRSKYALAQSPGLSFQYLGFNLSEPLLSDVRVRQAIAHAIDVDALVQHRQQGYSVRATGLLPPGNAHADDSLRPYPHDPALARRLLEQAGYPENNGTRFALTYKTTTDRGAIIQARVIADNLREVGIDVEVRSYEWATFYSDVIKGNFQLYSLRWIGVSDPGFLYELLHSEQVPPDGRNRGRYANKRMDRLLEQAQLEPDAAKRIALYREVHRIAYADLPYVPLWHNQNVGVVAKDLNGFRLHPSGGFEHLAQVRWAR